MKRTLLIIGGNIFFLAIVFTIVFIWTFDVSTTAHYIRISGYSVVRDFDKLREEFKAVYGVLAIVFASIGAITTICSVLINKKNNIQKSDII